MHARASPYVQQRHRVGGLMLANSTAVRHIFDRTLGLYDRLMERKVTCSDRSNIQSEAACSNSTGGRLIQQ